MKTTWKEFEHRGYTGVAVFYPANDEHKAEWVGEFNYPVRRIAHAFVGKTLDEAKGEFVRGVDSYHQHVSRIPGLRPEAQGLLGVIELLEMDRRGREYELSILDWPPAIHPTFVLIIKDMASLSHSSISYNQAALDELQAALESQPLTLREFRAWAERAWRRGELERTSRGMAISKAREEAEHA